MGKWRGKIDFLWTLVDFTDYYSEFSDPMYNTIFEIVKSFQIKNCDKSFKASGFTIEK